MLKKGGVNKNYLKTPEEEDANLMKTKDANWGDRVTRLLMTETIP